MLKKTNNVNWKSVAMSGLGLQCSLFLEIGTLVSWLKSTLLLKIECFDTHIYTKPYCLQTNEMQY